MHLGPELVVGPKHDETSPRDREGKEHLLSSFPPDLDLRQLVPFWDKEFPEKEKMYWFVSQLIFRFFLYPHVLYIQQNRFIRQNGLSGLGKNCVGGLFFTASLHLQFCVFARTCNSEQTRLVAHSNHFKSSHISTVLASYPSFSTEKFAMNYLCAILVIWL